MPIHIVLVEPQIPENTGNIARSCAATGAHLHLIHPLGFEVSEKRVKRAGLDYWDAVVVEQHASFAAFREKYPTGRCFMFTTKAKHRYSDVKYEDGDFLVFGREDKGLPHALLQQFDETTVRIPMSDAVRSLNLSNAAALALYEAYRQNDFFNLVEAGNGYE